MVYRIPVKNHYRLDQYHTLYLSLINNSDSSIVLQEKFLIEKGFSFGGFTLPDSLPSGSYRFVANTNIKKNNGPDGEFIHAITVKSTTLNPLTTNISIFKAYDDQRKTGTALVKVLTGDNRFVENAEIKYQIGNDKRILLAGTARSSVIGELMLDFPAEKITADNNQLYITVKKGKDIRYARFKLPVLKRSNYQILFYPEGGYLVDRLASKVGFEIKNLEGTVLNAKAVLYENDVPVDTIQSNSAGIGSFSICPQILKKYSVKILGEHNDDTKYPLPIVLNDGVVLTAGTAIAENDFRIHLEANNQKKVHVLVHNFSNILLHTNLMLEQNKTQSIRFKLDSVPAGLNAVSILDSNYKPIAERIFFAHYDQLNRADLITDKDEYNTRDQVNLKLKVSAQNKKPADALVSIACVQSNRLSATGNQNITDYFYLQQYLKPLPNRPMGIKSVDQDYLNDILLVKTWSRYKWPETEIKEVGKQDVFSVLSYHGKITRKNKPLDKPMGLTTIAGENLNFLNTDSAGLFNIPYTNLMIKEPKIPVWLAMTTAKYDQYEVKMDNPHDELKKYLVQQNFEMPSTRSDILNESNQSITALAGIRLKEVTITKNNEATAFANRAYNRCGDYVCRYNILNCPNHTADVGNTSPVKGKSYSTGRGGTMVYQGCTDEEHKPNIMILKGINLPKEFYESDISNKNEPINFATVYWNYQVLVKGETPITFNAGDLTGQFKIIVQGVTDGGVVYGEKEITVKNK
ncbi:hypothetical protein [Pedobacter sp. UBA5917]|uniref:hypothetical protein n=1 Tax=Pedobacter sp. UBA5917 TaxID=1947061 RepID=UPI0025EECEE1|nr:hypothetical protein [Pedobacter sp. UBA5917]